MNGLMYLIRIVIAAVIALFVVLLMKKKRRLALFISIVTVVLLVLSILFPVELFFVRFKTPTDAQSYAYFNNDIIDVVYGEESAFILSKDSDHGADYAYSVIQKDSKGYMIPVFGSEDVVHRIGMISIVRLKNTNDYYFFGLDKETGEYLSSLSNVYESHTIPVKSEGYVYCYGRCGLSGTQGDGTQD